MKKSEYKKMYELENSHFWFRGKRFFIQVYLNGIKKQINNILDVGAGTGGTTEFLSRYGKVIGLEKDDTAIKFAKKRRLNIIKGEAEHLPFRAKSFDLVTLLDVLYHQDIRSVDRAIKEVKRVLKSKGCILITDSAFDFLKGGHAQSVYEKRRFTIKQLTAVLNKNGFKIMKSSYIYCSIFPIVIIKRILVDRFFCPKESDVFSLFKIINWVLVAILKLESLLLSYIKLPVGSSLIVLARKKSKQ